MELKRRVLETVLCYVRDPAGRFLFMSRGKKANDVHTGKYNAPGGKLEPGESPVDCMRREVFEETNLTVEAWQRLGFLAFPGFHDDPAGPIDESVHVFLVTKTSGELRVEGPEGDLEWIPPEKVMALPLWEGDRQFLPYVLARKRFEGKLIYEKGKLVSWAIEETD